MKNIGTRIKEARVQKGWSQEVMAKAMGVTRGAISQWEAGDTNLSLDRLTAIADTLNVSEEWLRAGKSPQQDAGDVPISVKEWREALVMVETFSAQLAEKGHKPLRPQEKVDLAEMIAPALAEYLAKR